MSFGTVSFNFDGIAYASGVLSTITAAQTFKSASVASSAGTDISSAANIGRLFDPTDGIAKGLQVRAALITVEIAPINFTMDGSTPTVTAGTNLGHQLAAGQSYVISGENNVRNFQCINAVASSGAIVKFSMMR